MRYNLLSILAASFICRIRIVNEESSGDERFPIYAVGLIRNLSRQTNYETAIVQSLSRDGILLETLHEAELTDAVEVRINDRTLLGEVIRRRSEEKWWLLVVRLSHSLNDSELRRAVEQMLHRDRGSRFEPE